MLQIFIPCYQKRIGKSEFKLQKTVGEHVSGQPIKKDPENS